MTDTPKIHATAEVGSAQIGAGTSIWQNVVVLAGAKIGKDCNINAQCFVENDVVLGDRVTVKSGVYLWDGVHLQNDVFVGPNVTFTNDKFPRSKQYPEHFSKTVVCEGASIGGGAIILPGVRIERGAMVGAGAVVTKNVPPFAIVVGNPAQIVGYVSGSVTSGASTVVPATSPQLGSPVSVGVGAVKLHALKVVGDMRGDLSVGEIPTEIPFDVKRYFLVFNVPSTKTRGEHAHHQCHQFLICVKGSCSVVVDDGNHRAEVLLDTPGKGLHLPPLTWGIQYKYSKDAVLLVFASHAYDAKDYIRDYSEFTSVVKHHS
ncbi:WxcM-like domain-containing protein [Comamonas sediminis]|uniref:WxcM-like domain-containing protein n=1 Tax=Comamonas sediminis TaxID=1783360 RepID=A0ABV4B3F5_9BURK